MWKVKRMNPARIAVLAVAIVAGGIAAYLASGSGEKAAPPPVAQMQTVDVLVAKNEIGLGQSVKPDDLQWQTWPAATASNNFITRTNRPEATKEITGSIARAPFIAGEPIREPKLVKADGSGFMGGFSLPSRTIREMICASIDVIVQAARLRDGSRRITHITEVMGMEGDTIITQDVFLYDMIGEDANGKIIGRHRSTGIGRPRFWERARYFGEEKRLAAALDAAEVAEAN